ncbi:hypothetical protein LK07_26710 [Streptomyces pluripotens]|uniref:Transposase IS4-like domain-containing protein n=1 Tax=Streptomyces pluripotens TaxID=1355015 RepID=A0A221P9G2_9ACTN|nr:hypothetical protein LK06_025550 [Streptomyces pluripotens]ASN28716.1 hypothetical protein LK07_26710 [Streptomyces pluripotens]
MPRTKTFRLVTSLLDPKLAPARQLATAYHQRWEIENGFAELKTACAAPDSSCAPGHPS